MRRRSAQRIYEARRAGLTARLADTSGPERAERAVREWEEEAERRGLAGDSDDFWRQAEAWLTERSLM